MGWLYTAGMTKERVVASRTVTSTRSDGSKHETLAHSVQDCVLWTVNEITRPDGSQYRYIGCDLLENQPNFGWGYKSLCEEMEPYQYSCPLSYFDLVPEPAREATSGWRKTVRAYHAKRTTPLPA